MSGPKPIQVDRKAQIRRQARERNLASLAEAMISRNSGLVQLQRPPQPKGAQR